MIAALVAIELVTLHMIDGRVVLINPAAVQQLYHPTKNGNRLVAPATKCLVKMASNYLSVLESCEDVQRLLQGNSP